MSHDQPKKKLQDLDPSNLLDAELIKSQLLELQDKEDTILAWMHSNAQFKKMAAAYGEELALSPSTQASEKAAPMQTILEWMHGNAKFKRLAQKYSDQLGKNKGNEDDSDLDGAMIVPPQPKPGPKSGGSFA